MHKHYHEKKEKERLARKKVEDEKIAREKESEFARMQRLMKQEKEQKKRNKQLAKELKNRHDFLVFKNEESYKQR